MRALRGALIGLALALVLGPLVAVIVQGLSVPVPGALGHPVPVVVADPGRLVAVWGREEVRALLMTLEVGAVAAATALALGWLFGILVAGSRVPGRSVLAALAALVLVLPPYLTAASWIDLFGPAGRWSRPLLASLGLERSRVSDLVYTAGTAGLVLGAGLFPLVALAVAAADRRLDRRILEAARLARGRWGVARVTVGLLGPPALGAALAVFAFVLTEFAVPQVLRARTLGEAIYDRIQENDRLGAAALGVPLVLLVGLAGGLGAWLLGKVRVASGAGLERGASRFEPRRRGISGKALGLVLGLALVTPGLFFPLVSFATLASTAPLVGVRGGPGKPAAEPDDAPTGPPIAEGDAAGFGRALARAWTVAGEDARRTVGLGALAATVAALLAAVLGRGLARRSRTGGLTLAALTSGLAVPAPLVGLGLVVLWNRRLVLGPLDLAAVVYDTTVVVALAWLARFFPLALLLARAGFARVPPELEEAAALLGQRWPARLRSVVLPLAAPGVVAAWLATYVLATSEYEATAIVVPPGRPLLAVTVVNLVHYGRDAEIAACALLLVAALALPLLPGALLLAWARRREGGSP